MAVATCQWQLQLAFWPVLWKRQPATWKSKCHRPTNTVPGTRQFDWRFPLARISPLALAISSACMCISPFTVVSPSPTVNPPVPLAVWVLHACILRPKEPPRGNTSKSTHLRNKFVKLHQMGKFATNLNYTQPN